MAKFILGMRDTFFDALYDIAKKDNKVMLVSADCGAPSLDKFREKLKDQYITVGIAEQNMVSVAAGLAIEGNIVYMYAIAPFVTLRCYEQIKVDICCMNLPVTAIGVGAGLAYDIMGPTHHATEDISIMRALPNMTIFNPSDSIMSEAMARASYELPGPKYVRFDRTGIPDIYTKRSFDIKEGLVNLKSGSDVCIIATGNMVERALKVAQELSKHSIEAGVIDLFRIKPINEKLLLEAIGRSSSVVTLEEHMVTGGIGSAVAEAMADNSLARPILRLGICDEYFFEYGGREVLHCLAKLDRESVTKRIIQWFPKRNRVMANI